MEADEQRKEHEACARDRPLEHRHLEQQPLNTRRRLRCAQQGDVRAE